MKAQKARRRFFLLAAMLLTGGVASAQVVIKGNIYGGCEFGVVSTDATVTINKGTVKGDVYGGGMGIDDDETRGLVKGNTNVIMSDGHVEKSIYGGGELGSVGTFLTFENITYPNNSVVRVPLTCKTGTGLATVKISGGMVGLNQTLMPTPGTPAEDDEFGYVFCGGRGEADSITYYKALAMAVVDKTYLEISGTALITASAYGGCENGLVLKDTHVKMLGGQIGTGYWKDNENVNHWDGLYDEADWNTAIAAVRSGNATDINDAAAGFHECHSWPYGWVNPVTHKTEYNTYDLFYDYDGTGQTYVPANSSLEHASDGHSFFGNLFGGGSGYYPIAPGVWRRTAGQVKGNILIEIEGGHILTTVYGGNETTDVGTYGTDGVTWISGGKSTITMSGGTVGVPRTVSGIQGHPVTCSLFGAGMGDPRVWANTWTNVHETEVTITGGTVFGSVFGGGEEGHVLSNTKVSISESANAGTGDDPYTVVGTWGHSGYEGFVYGAGRGFRGDALTAGTIGGNSVITITGGMMRGSIFGGGRNASVGTHFTHPLHENYGQFEEDDPTNHLTYGHTTINISGGTIGNDHESGVSHTFGGNVYGGSKGTITQMDGTTPSSLWPRLARVKITEVNITGGTIKGYVYGGGELGTVRDSTMVVIGNTSGANPTIKKVFGGGYGSTEIRPAYYSSDSVAYPALLAGRVEGNTRVLLKSGTVQTNLYGGGELATVGRVVNNVLKKGKCSVVVSGGSVGLNTMYTTYDPNHIVDYGGHVYGGGQGTEGDTQGDYDPYNNVNRTHVIVEGGKIYGSVFGGGAESHVLGDVKVAIYAPADIGSIGTTSWDGNVFGGGQGDCTVNSTDGRVAGNINIIVDGGHIRGSIFGGGRHGITGIDKDGNFIDKDHGNVTIAVSGIVDNSGENPVYSTIIGIDDYEDLLESDESVGDIFGSGKGDTDNYEDVLAGRTTNTSVTVTGFPRIYGSVFGGGEMAGVGYWNTSGENIGKFEENTGITEVTIGTHDGTDNPLIGTEYEFTMPSSGEGHYGKWTLYETIDGVTKLAHTATGNVYGGCQGDVDINTPAWVSMGRSHTATVNIHGGRIMSCVFGGSEQGTMAGNTEVNICRGIIGQPSLTASNSTTYSYGSVYGGGYGSDDLRAHTNDSSNVVATKLAGRTYGNTVVNISGGQVYENVFGGGDVASVGWVDGSGNLKNGHCEVNVGNLTTPSTAIIGPLDGTGLNGYVYGGGQGIGNDPDNPATLNIPDEQYKLYCNVNSTAVTVNLASTGHVWGSLFGGGADGHVLGNTLVTLEGGTIGTNGTTSWDGNIFGGGRNFLKKNYTAGRVEGNTHVVMNGGTLLGTIFGGGRLGITGINEYGVMQEGTAHGNTLVEVTGGTVGNSALMETWTTSTMGDVYGGGKGDLVGVAGHPPVSALLLALVKNSEVVISGTAQVLGSVFGGGEVANLGHFDWQYNVQDLNYDPDDPDHNLQYTIGNISIRAGTGVANVTVKGGTIGATKMKIRYELADGAGNFNLKYNDDVGHVFGGGEGLNRNPALYAQHVNPGTEGGHNDKNLLDLMATVGETHVTITKEDDKSAWVKGSVYGGGMNGHVLRDANVTVSGGVIGAGYNQKDDVEQTKYTDDQFFNVLTYMADNAHDDVDYPLSTNTETKKALFECVHWKYDPLTNNPFDLIKLKTVPGYKPTDGKTWFGCVFGGGSGYYPYIVEPTAGVYEAHWNREAGKVYGNATVNISDGHILTNVYGGSETADLGHFTYDDEHGSPNGGTYVSGGEVTVTMSGGTVGVPRTMDSILAHPVTCYLFGAGKGDQRVEFNTYTNVKQSTVTVNGGKIYGSVFGGGEDGHVFYDATVNISETTPSTKPTIIGTTGRSAVDGNIFGGGRGFSGEALTAGVVQGNVDVNIKGGTMLGSIYGGGRLAAVGTYLVPSTTTTKYGKMMPNVGTTEKHGEITVKIGEVDGLTQVSNITIGNDYEAVYHTNFDQPSKSGNVFAGGMGRLDNLNGSTNSSWHQFGRVKNTTLKIGQASGKKTNIKGSVYGGGELGIVGGESNQTENHDANITISGGTIWRDVYGGGFGSDNTTKLAVIDASTNPQTTATPMQLAGLVQGNTTVSVTGGWVKKCIYGGGEFGTVGTITSTEIHPEQVGETPAHAFNLSWPCAYTFENNTGTATISITGGRVGVTGKDFMGPYRYDQTNNTLIAISPVTGLDLSADSINYYRVDNGDLYGGCMGKAGDRYEMANLANVNNTVITITYPENNGATPQNYNAIANGVYTYDCIAGAVYGGAENGHVNTNTSITLNKGLVGHSMYGGGKGKGTYKTTLEWQYDPSSGTYVQVTPYTASVYSITAGKVYGNTNIVINDGYVVRSIFGGGNLGSVGKGNYAGGVNDYSANGYGEKITNASDWNYVHNSGQCNVTVKGGTIGMLNASDPDKVFKDGTPYGTVFGGCRGVPVPTVPRTLTPRYKYCPEDFLGYVNYTFVTIGDNTVSTTPRLYGSVYGGAQDGHVRENTNTTVNKGEIGVEYNAEGIALVGPNELVTSKHWTERGNVYGAGSGIGQWEDQHGNKYYCNIAGSVTQFSNVTINGGTIHNNVYGGGNLATVGPPRIRQTEDCPIDSTKVMVTVTGGTLGHENDAHYGGYVFGASRGIASNNVNDFKNFALCSYTQVDISGGTIANAVFGGGENGQVGSYHENATTHVEDSKGNHNTLVNINGGTIKHSVYGGGQGVYGETGYANDTISGRVMGNTTVNLMDGIIGVDNGNYAAAIYGGCRNANIWGNTNVNVGSRTTRTDTFEGNVTIYGSVYGANNHNGTPYGNVNVDVYSTAHTGSSSAAAPNFEGLGNSYPNVPTGMTPAQKLAWLESIPKDESNFAIYQVFGGSNQADYTPRAGKKARVKVWQCDKNTIFDVYGGSNAAAIGTTGTPSEANVIIEGGRMNRVFGGGNGNPNPADVHGPANTTINAGLINELYGGSNNAGLIDVVNLVVNPEGTCPQIIGDVFSGGNEALVIGDVITTVECCDAVYGNFYCGTHYATIYGNVTANIFGGTYSNIFAGSKGQLGNPNANPPVPEKPAHIRRFPINNADLQANYPAEHQAALAAYLDTHDVWGQGGNVTLNIFGGNIGNAFGGSDVNGNIDGKIQVNVFNVGGTCNLDLVNLYGAGRNTAYTPNYTVSGNQQRLTPEINVIHGEVRGSVFGGGMGESATTTANPVVNIGYYADLGVYGHEGDLMDKLFDTIHAHSDEPGHPWVAPTDYLATVGHEVYGGGQLADIYGDPAVNVNKNNTEIAMSLYGGGQGRDGDVDAGKVHGSTAVKIYNGLIKRMVFGGGEMSIITGDTRVEMSGGTVGTSSEYNLFGTVYGGGQGATSSQGQPASGMENYGRVMGNTYVDISGSAHIYKEVYGGGQMGSVGSGNVNDNTTGVTHVTVSGGEIGPYIAAKKNANVYGGGQGYIGEDLSYYTNHANVDSTRVIITGNARIYGNVFGGSGNGHVLAGTYVQVKKGTGSPAPTPTIGTTGLTGEDGHVYGGGQGTTGSFTAGRVGGCTKVEISDGNILGCVYGGGRMALTGVNAEGEFSYFVPNSTTVYDTVHHGTTQVEITGGVIGNNANNGNDLLTSDQISGNVYGAGRGDPDEHKEDDWGRVAKSVLSISGSPTIYGSVYGGGQMANVGHWFDYDVWYTEGTSVATVNISGSPTIGTAKEFTKAYADTDPDHTFYETIQGKKMLVHTRTGNVYGSGQGDVKLRTLGLPWDGHPVGFEQGHCGKTFVNIKYADPANPTDSPTIMGSVFGGAEQGAVWGNTNVNISCGTIGTVTNTDDDSGATPNLTNNYAYGSVFGGSYGKDAYIHLGFPNVLTAYGVPTDSIPYLVDSINGLTGRVYGNTRVIITGGTIRENVFGGGDMASVGEVNNGNLVKGKCTVEVSGTAKVGPLDMTGLNGYVYGGGKGIGNDPDNLRKKYCNVNETDVTVNLIFANAFDDDHISRPDRWSSTTDGRIYGSIFGGGADGHTLGDAWVKLQSGLIGTEGTTSWDGNIFGGGRNFHLINYTAGRVGGNVTVEMTGGHLLGSLYGGGRNALTGLGEDVFVNTSGFVQALQDDTDSAHPKHGKITVMVKGGVIGNNTLTNLNSDDPTESFVETFSDYSMGSVYGGGKGTLDGIVNHPKASALLIGMVKETDVQISQVNPNVPTRVYGIVFGGGEIASVGSCIWKQDGTNFTDIDMQDGTGLAKVTISGGIIGADRAKMRWEPGTGDYAMYPKYNDDLGYVYGGGEGYSDDPLKEEGGHRVYPDVNTANLGDLPLLDIAASVNNTEVNISGGWVKASVFGGAEAGHVLQNTKVNISGGQIGAGDNTVQKKDELYTDGTNETPNQFINPIVTVVTTSNSLYGTTHWRYASPYNPYDPAEIANDPDHYEPTDGKSWFGNVFGGGSGWFPYIKNLGDDEHPNYKSYWNANSGKVWGDAEVNITGGHILNNVYGANETTDVGGKATVKMSGGTVGVPRTKEQVAQQPVTCYVFGGGGGEGRSDFDGITNCASTDVQISGGIIYGSAFGGAEDGHVLGNVDVTVSPGAAFTVGTEPNAITYHYPVIGSTGKSGADGNIFCGGRNFFGDNLKAGRVEGNITLNMSGGALLGSVFGGGRYALTGIDANGDMITTDPTLHGNTNITISGGVVGNRRDILVWLDTPNHTSMGDVFASGKGDAKSPDLGKVKNASVTITGSAEVLGSVYGGGEMSNVGWYNPSTNSCVEGTGDARVTISGGQVGIEQNTYQVNIVGGNVFGGGKGVPGNTETFTGSGSNTAVQYGNVDNTLVTISGGYITNSVFGGGEDGHVITHTVINMSDGTVGQKNTLAELEVDADEQPVVDHIYTGSVLGGGRGTTPVTTSPLVYSDMTGRVFGNATVTISGGTVRHAVYGGGGLASVGTSNSNDSDGLPVFEDKTGLCTVNITGGHIGPTKADLTGYSDAQLNTFFKNLGGNAGWVFGAGCGLTGQPTLTFNDSTYVSISGANTQIVGSVFGGGETAHVKTLAEVKVSGGTIGGIPLHGEGEVHGTGAFADINFTSDVDELGEDIYGAGRRVFRGNVYGGGKGTDFLDKDNKIYSSKAGRVYGDTKVTIEGGTIYNRVFGGGSMASVGVYNATTVGAPDHIVDSITSLKAGGTTTVLVKGGTIGTDGNNNGDVFGGGRGLVGRHWDRWHQYNDQVVFLAYVGNTNVTIQDGATIKSNVYGGSANGHVQQDARVTVTGGTIGIEGHGGWHSNVYGGGGGHHQYQKGSSTHHSITSGRVFGNTYVNISGGTIKHNVYGGGAIASVGTYNIYDPAHYIVGNTGIATVTITGGTIGYDGNENGMVFGSGRGQIAPIDAFMDSLSYVVNSTVTIGTLNSGTGPMVHGSVYGSGENGHVYGNTQVNVHSGTIGCASYDNAHASYFANHGNVYGAGCGTDLIDESNPISYNPRSGMVWGNTEVNITGGHISHAVYGGGAMALVGSYTTNGEHWTGGIKEHLSGGQTTVNVSGGTIGTSNAPSNVDHGNVYAASRGPIDDVDGFDDIAITDITRVFISGDAQVLGSVYGGGEKSWTRTARIATVSGGTIGTDGNNNGNVFGGGKNGIANNKPFTSLKTANVRGGHIKGNVFGGSYDAHEKTAPNTWVDGYNYWSSFVNITGGEIDKNVYGGGYGGSVDGSVCVNVGLTAIQNAHTYTTQSSTEVDQENKYYNVGPTSNVTLTRGKLVIGGDIFGGSFKRESNSGNNWDYTYDITGYSRTFIDGDGYDMTAITPGTTFNNLLANCMNIGGGIYGSGNFCESGAKDQSIVLRKYGARTTVGGGGDDNMTDATRTLTTLQRAATVFIDNSNVHFSGAVDISQNESARQFAVLKVADTLYVVNSSGIVLGAEGAAASIDSIGGIQSLHLKSGTVYEHDDVTNTLYWEWIGINHTSGNGLNTPNNARLCYSSLAPDVALTPAQENVIIFNADSKLWVRYWDKSAKETKFGPLIGFFRMNAEHYTPVGTTSFAYARPKLTDKVNGVVGYATVGQNNIPTGNTWNAGDGGFLSYNTAYNFFVDKTNYPTVLGYDYPVDGDDGGRAYTNTKQYPYYNVTVGSKGNTNIDMKHYREWVLRSIEGQYWYVDGRGIGSGHGWGKNANHQDHWGHKPDMPKLTITGDGGIFDDDTYWNSSHEHIYDNYVPDKDIIFVVGPIESALENETLNKWPNYPLKLFRYPGGHLMSNGERDKTAGDSPVPASTYNGLVNEGSTSTMDPTKGPGANKNMMIHVTDNLILDSVRVDGLYTYNSTDITELTIPESYKDQKKKVTKPMVVTSGAVTLTLKGNTTLKRGYNGTNGNVWYTNSDYTPGTNVHHGGGLYVDEAATVEVEGFILINSNQQLNGKEVIKSNVYLPTFDKALTITNTLDASSRIGITSPKRNTAEHYLDNTFSPVAVAANATIANDAWTHDNFTDDQDWFFTRKGRSTYHFYDSEVVNVLDEKTLYFGWTWANVVRKEPSGYSESDNNITISTKEGLAWLTSQSAGLSVSPIDFTGKTISQTDDFDMKQYVWVPIGTYVYPFNGTYDGKGHLINNIFVEYIGKSDKVYQRHDYGLFGLLNGTVKRTFVVGGHIHPENLPIDGMRVENPYNLGGLVGQMDGKAAVVANSEAAEKIVCPNYDNAYEVNAGGLVGLMKKGRIHSSMSMSEIDMGALVEGPVGGLVGSSEEGSIYNSFANVKLSVTGSTNTKTVGGLVGSNTKAKLSNCYVALRAPYGLTSGNFGSIAYSNPTASNIEKCYVEKNESYSYIHEGNGSCHSSCRQYTPVIGSDNLGYQYYDNRVEGDTTLVVRLNKNAWLMNKPESDSVYAHWARPGIPEINGDLPVLLLSEFDGTKAYQGDFRSVGTYAGGPALQYGGPARDGSTDEVSYALSRPLEKNSSNVDIPDYLFVYGDVANTITLPTGKSITQSKVSINEHVSILHPGALGVSTTKADYTDTYVGISFDNSCGHAMATPSVNYGLQGHGGDLLPRDWHMFSTPLANAPQGFDYQGHNAAVPENDNFDGQHWNNAGRYNNPWFGTSTEFSWLNGGGTGNNRYWMGNDDGYFPSSRGNLFDGNVNNLFIIGSDECPSEGQYRYPYGMDFYTWTEPDYHWINFKRNGPNHWHTDGDDHEHIAYQATPTAAANVNETTLIPGKGYLGSITKPTFMQSHGTLNSGTKTIPLTEEGHHLTGWNLVGNPFHGYIDFNEFSGNTNNTAVLQKNNANQPFYVVYDADTYDGRPGSGFLYQPKDGSLGGEYAGRYIHPHQGFYVKLVDGATNNGTDPKHLEFTEDMLVTRNSVKESHFREWERNYPLVNLYLSSDGGCRDVTVIELDRPEWGGATKLKELRVGNGIFYGHHGDDNYAAMFVEKGTPKVPLWFEAKEDDIYTMTWKTANGDFHSMYLIDNITGIQYDMLRNNTYQFEGHKGDYWSRFYIVFDVEDVDENGNDGFVFFDGSQWVVTGDGELEVIDVLGHILKRTNVEGQARISLNNVAEGLYLMRLTNGKQCRMQKVVVTR